MSSCGSKLCPDKSSTRPKKKPDSECLLRQAVVFVSLPPVQRSKQRRLYLLGSVCFPFHTLRRRVPGQPLRFLEDLLILFYLRLYEGLELRIGGLEQVIYFT